MDELHKRLDAVELRMQWVQDAKQTLRKAYDATISALNKACSVLEGQWAELVEERAKIKRAIIEFEDDAKTPVVSSVDPGRRGSGSVQ